MKYIALINFITAIYLGKKGFYTSKMIVISPFNCLFICILAFILQKCKRINAITAISLFIPSHNNFLEENICKIQPRIIGTTALTDEVETLFL